MRSFRPVVSALVACGLWMVAASLESSAAAAVFRCTTEGRTLYTDRPCRAGDAPHALPWLGLMPAGPQADLAAEHDDRRERIREARQRDDAAWLEAHSERKEHDRRMEQAIGEKRTSPGMSADQVRRALGRPDAIKRDRQGGEHWTYRDGKKQRTVRLRDGKVMGRQGKASPDERTSE